MKPYYVYIMTNPSRTLYVGVTNDLERRVAQHKLKLVPGFTERYNVTRLAYFEIYDSISAAIEREKRIKGWSRRKKIALVLTTNPTWRDLAVEPAWWLRGDGSGRDSSHARNDVVHGTAHEG